MEIVSKASSHPTAVFTIVSRNYFHYARVLMQSLQDVHPDWERFVLLADAAGDALRPAPEEFQVIEASALEIPEPEKFFFRYTILELNTAVKPWFFRHLFAAGYDRVVYLDPDIFVYSPLVEVEQSFDAGALAVLVPHLTGRLLDDARPGEREILQSGTYNLGFCALARHAEQNALLEFWCAKSLREFVSDVSRGLFTDQRWMDLVPGMFSDVVILRHEGYDVAYWNLPHRRLESSGDRIQVNGVRLVFFHFSGIDPLNPEVFSKHQDRYRMSTVGAAAGPARRYCSAVLAAGLKTYRDLPYTYGFLRDGSPIPDVLRRLYRTDSEVEDWAGDDPFARSCEHWNQPLDQDWPPLTRVMLAVYQARSDIRLIWPDVLDRDRERFVRWFVETSELQHIVADCYVRPVREALNEARTTPVSASSARSDAHSAMRTDLIDGALRKAWAAFRERRLPLSPRRWLQLFRLHTIEEKQHELLRAGGPLPPAAWSRDRGRQSMAPYQGFHQQSPDEAAAGVAWMGRAGSVTLDRRSRAQVVVSGHHLASVHAHCRGTAALTLHAELAGITLAQQTLHAEGSFQLCFTLPDQDDDTLLVLRTADVFVPSRAGLGSDPRELSVQLKCVQVDGHRLLDFGRTDAIYQPEVHRESAPQLTIVGYLSEATGVAAGAHSSVAACREAQIASEVIDARSADSVRGRYRVTLLHVNADQTPIVAAQLGEEFFRGRYTIGMWAWELEEFPDVFLQAFNWTDEVWAMSRFVLHAVAEKSPVPVVHMPLSVSVQPTVGRSRADFGLPEGPFLFLMMYDALSVQERKNPLGALEAFRRAFRVDAKVGIVIKVNHAASRPEEVARVRQVVADMEGAMLIDRPMSREDAQALQLCCDAFVSLHRSEGFGLNIAEAMLLGKPVVTTGWSGNMDFTSSRNACLVDYTLSPLAADYRPYQKGNVWAEPELDQAAEFMLRLVEDGVFLREIASRGQITIATDFSAEAIGRRYRRRLKAIERFL